MKQRLKIGAFLLSLILILSFAAGCNPDTKPSPTPTDQIEPGPTNNAEDGQTESPGEDVETTASIVNTQEAFVQAISSNGTWIICLVDDLTINKDIALDGEFTNGKKDDQDNDIVQRKIALYTQDQDRNITNRFTLTAPKFTINSPKASIQHGSFKGDLYVSAEYFELIDTKVEGNVYFTTEKAQSTFSMDETSKITGKKELQTGS